MGLGDPISRVQPKQISELIFFTCIYKLLELRHLRKPLFPNLELAIKLCLAENHSLRLGGANSHPRLFRFTWKPKVSLKLRLDEANRTICKKQSRINQISLTTSRARKNSG